MPLRLHRRHFAALALFAALAVAHTWPLARHPGVNSRLDNADYTLNAWAVHWVAQTLATAPSELFHAGIFYPHRYALAYSEPLILPGALAMPVIWSGGSAVLALNLVLLAGFALSAWAFALYTERVTGSLGAGLITGSLVAFNAHHLMRIAHLQALHLELLPLVFVALDALLERRRLRDAWSLGLALAAQATISIYLLIFTAWALVWAALVRVREWTGRGRWRAAALLASSAVAAVIFAAPILWPYYVLWKEQSLERTVEQALRYSSSWTDYLYTGGRIHHDWWSHRFDGSEEANFPGFIAAGLAVVALVTGWRHGTTVRMWSVVAAGAVLLSVAPHLPGFSVLHGRVPGLEAIRVYGRAGQMAIVAIAVLAGVGASCLLERLRSPGARRWLVAALVAAVNAEAWRAPLPYVEYSGIPRIYDVLAAEPAAVVVELPFYRHRYFFRNAPYMLYATAHGHPLLNGYSGFAPPNFDLTAAVATQMPATHAVGFLRQRGVTHVVVHRERYDGEELDAFNASPHLATVAADEDISIYRLREVGGS